MRAMWDLQEARALERTEWVNQFGDYGENASPSDLGIDGNFLRSLLFFTRLHDLADVQRLAAACALVLQSPPTLGANDFAARIVRTANSVQVNPRK